MPLITCYAKLNFCFSDLRSLLPHRHTYNGIKISNFSSFWLVINKICLYWLEYLMSTKSEHLYISTIISMLQIDDVTSIQGQSGLLGTKLCFYENVIMKNMTLLRTIAYSIISVYFRRI